MSNQSPEFWQIIEAQFPEQASDRLLDESVRRQVRYDPEADEKDIQSERIIAASYDERIAAYFVHGVGTEESLIAQLQSDYGLSEQEAVDAIDKGIGQLTEVTDYGDEA